MTAVTMQQQKLANAAQMQPHLVVATIVHCMPIQRSLGIGGADVVWKLHQRLQVTRRHNLSPLSCEMGFAGSAIVCILPGGLQVTGQQFWSSQVGAYG